MEPQIQYCRSEDGTRLAYSAFAGGPTLLRISPWFINLEDAFHYAPMSAYLTGYLPYRRLVTFDRRGVGASQREIADLSLEAHVQDALAVANKCESEVFDLIGEVDGSYVALALAARCPERVNRVIVYGPLWGDRSYYTRTAKSIRDDWSAGRRLLAGDMYPDGPVESQRWLGQSLKASVSQDVAARYMEAIAGFDVGALTPHVSAPTLVFGRRSRTPGTDDPRGLAAAIPDARYVALARESDLRPFLRAMSRFLMGDDAGEEMSMGRKTISAAGTAIILFADIVDSTALTEHMGDAAFRAKARDLDVELRRIITEAGGTAIDGKLLGDGVLATFPAASQGIDAAMRCAAAGEALGLPLHLGLHAGDVIREEGNVFGGAVNIASRISGLSAPGEVLVSRTVRDLARTSAGVAFEDRGEHALKGVGDAVRVFAVLAQEQTP